MCSINNQGQLRKQILTASREILKSARNCRISNLELQRLNYDLQISKKRFISREYRQSSFKPRTTMSTPERTAEIASDLNFYWSVASVWQSIISQYFSRRTISVAEIGCGHISKVALGLTYFDFWGQLTLIDQDKHAIDRALECLDYFGARFMRSGQTSSVFDNTRKFDAILANHLIDDLILSRFCKLNRVSLSKLYEDEKLYLRSWQKILENPAFLADLAKDFAAALVGSLNENSLILLLDYDSFSHKALGISAVTTLVSGFKQSLKTELAGLSATELKPLASDITFGRMTIKKEMLLAFSTGEKSDDAK